MNTAFSWGDRSTYVLFFQNSSQKLSRNIEISKRIWKCVFPSFFQIHSAAHSIIIPTNALI